jgi:ankyrin repeat protein
MAGRKRQQEETRVWSRVVNASWQPNTMKELIAISALLLSMSSSAQDMSTETPDESQPMLEVDQQEIPKVDVAAILSWSPIFKGRPFNSRLLGFRVFPGRDWKQFGALGFEQGDLLQEVDGVALSDPKLNPSDFKKLGAGEKVTVVVERSGQREELTFKLRQPTRDDYRDEISRKDLFEAARDGDVERVQKLIDAGADVNDTTSGHGMSALAIAVDQASRDVGQVAVVELLLRHGANADIRDGMGRTLLVYAVTEGAPVVKALLDGGIDVNAQDDLGRTALSNAIIGKDDEVFDLLLEYGADVHLSSDGVSIELQSALANNHVDRVVKLLDLGVDVNARSHDGQTALFAAVDSNWSPMVDAVQLLLERGALANIEDHYGHSPLKLAKKRLKESLRSEKSAMKRAKAGKSFGATPEMVQQKKRDYQQIVTLLELAGAREQVPTKMSLLYAARVGELAAVSNYLQKGEDVDAIDAKNGYSPLIWALSQDHEEVANKLLNIGADPNIVALHGETALMVAVERGATIETVGHLLDSGADPNLQTGSGTALMLAALHSPIEFVKLLLDSGADPNLGDGGEGVTAAYAAMMTGRKDVLDLLIAAGAK